MGFEPRSDRLKVTDGRIKASQKNLGYSLFHPLSQRESLWRYMGAPCGLRVARMDPAKAGTGMGLPYRLVLANPQELPTLIGFSQQMVPEGQMAVQGGLPPPRFALFALPSH